MNIIHPFLPTTIGRIIYQRIALLIVLLICLQGLNVFAFNIGDKVQANGLVWVRKTAGGTYVGTQASGTQGMVIGGPAYAQVGGTGNTFTWYNVHWPSAPDGWVGDVGLKAAMVAVVSTPALVAQPAYTAATAVAPSISSVLQPSITGISPASLPPLNGNQLLTISGNNFQSGATLTFVPPEGGSINSLATKLTFVSANQINYQINNLSDRGNWTVRVNNPGGQSSSSVTFTVAAAAQSISSPVVASPVSTSALVVQPVYTTTTVAAPSIISVSPATLPPMNGNQLLTISGYNFQNGATLTFVPPEGGTINSSAAKLTFVSANQINYQINNLSDRGNWTVRVNNPGGQTSSSVSFTVAAAAQSISSPVVVSPVYTPATAVAPTISSALQPSISGIYPASLPPLNGNQPLTITGNNFQNGATLTFVPPEGGTINSYAAKLTFVSANQINYQINNLSDRGNWTVQVNNPNGQSSSPASFMVAASSQTAPSLAAPNNPAFPKTGTPTFSLLNPPTLTSPNNAANTQMAVSTPMTANPSSQPVDANLAKEALDYALLSDQIYYLGAGNYKAPNGWEAVGTSMACFLDPKKAVEKHGNGFKASAFIKGKQIAIVFQGTTGPFIISPSWQTDISNLMGWKPEQYQDALAYVDNIKRQYAALGYNIVLTGHSLGGGLATYAAYKFKLPAIVFNPAPLGIWMIGDILQILNTPDSLIRNIDMRGDIVSGFGVHKGQISILDVPVSVRAQLGAEWNAVEDARHGLPFIRDYQQLGAGMGLTYDAVNELHSMANLILALQALPNSMGSTVSSPQQNIGSPSLTAPATYSPPLQVGNVPSINKPQLPAGLNKNTHSPMMPGVDLTPSTSK